MVSRWISVMGCDKWSAPSSASHSTSQSLSKSGRQRRCVIDKTAVCDCDLKKLTASSASFSECVDMPPVLLRFVLLCSLSLALKDSCSSLSKLVKLTLLNTGMELGYSMKILGRRKVCQGYLLWEFFVQSVRSSIAVHDLRRLSLSV